MPDSSFAARAKNALRFMLAFLMIAIGVMHFAAPAPFEQIVPRWLPSPALLVAVSGVFEILGGLGVLIARTRRAAGWGLIALFVAVFPANVNMAINEIQVDPSSTMPVWMMWARLPFQALFIAWAYWVAAKSNTAK